MEETPATAEAPETTEPQAVAEAQEATPSDPGGQAPTVVDGIVKELPCGLVQGEMRHRWAEFVPMSGHVRKAISKKGVRDDFMKVADMVLRLCVKRIGPITTEIEQALQVLPMADRDFLLLEIRRASMGDELRALITCAGCKKKVQSIFQIDELRVVQLKDDDFEIHNSQLCFRIQTADPRLDALCRYPIGADQAALLASVERNPTEAQYDLYTACLLKWNGESGSFASDFFDAKPVRVIDAFAKQFVAKKPGPVFDQRVSCPNKDCGVDIDFTFEGSDFFFPLPDRGTT